MLRQVFSHFIQTHFGLFADLLNTITFDITSRDKYQFQSSQSIQNRNGFGSSVVQGKVWTVVRSSWTTFQLCGILEKTTWLRQSRLHLVLSWPRTWTVSWDFPVNWIGQHRLDSWWWKLPYPCWHWLVCQSVQQSISCCFYPMLEPWGFPGWSWNSWRGYKSRLTMLFKSWNFDAWIMIID